MSNAWLYQNEEFNPDLIAKHAGFVYCITHHQTGRKYIGKKVFYFSRKVKGTETKSKRTKVESDWRDYFGSNEELLKDVSALRKR